MTIPTIFTIMGICAIPLIQAINSFNKGKFLSGFANIVVILYVILVTSKLEQCIALLESLK
jgi:hypothetical protein